MQSFLQIIFAASICDLILTTLITYYRVFCIRHHSKNTLYLPLSLSDILLTAMIQYWPELSSPSLSVSFQWNYVGYDPRWLLRVHLRAHSCVCVWNCVNWVYVNISRFLPLCCADLVQTLLLLVLCAHLLLLLRLGTVPLCSILLRARRYLLLCCYWFWP